MSLFSNLVVRSTQVALVATLVQVMNNMGIILFLPGTSGVPPFCSVAPDFFICFAFYSLLLSVLEWLNWLNPTLKYIFQILFKSKHPAFLKTTETACETADRASCQIHTVKTNPLMTKRQTLMLNLHYDCGVRIFLNNKYKGAELPVSHSECLHYKILYGKPFQKSLVKLICC